MFIILIVLFIILEVIAWSLQKTLTTLVKKYEHLGIRFSRLLLKQDKLHNKVFKYIIWTLNFLIIIIFVYLIFSLVKRQMSVWLLITFLAYPIIVIFLGTFLGELQKILNEKGLSSKKIQIPTFLKDNYAAKRIGDYGGSTFYHGSIYIIILYILSKLVTDIYTTVPTLFIFLIMIPFS